MAIKQRLNERLAEAKAVLVKNNSVETETKPLDIVPTFAISVDDARQRVAMLQEFVKSMMIQGQDYGVIPGCNKPSLFKSGAEKLCDIYGFSNQVEIINRVEDWDKPFLHYEVKVTLTNKRTGLMESEGIGSCNSMERKYESQSSFTIANTLIKMAKKRALVDAVLSATRSSGIFSQDLEDLDLMMPIKTPDVSQQNYHSIAATTPTHIVSNNVPATPSQLKKILILVKELRLSNEDAKKMLEARYQINSSQQLTKKDASNLIQHLLSL